MTPAIAVVIVLGCIALSFVMPVVVGILTMPKVYAPADALLPPADDLAVRSESTNPDCTHPNRPEPVEVDLGDGPTTIGHICPDCFGTVGVCLSCWDAENPLTIRTADDARALLDAQRHLVDHLAERFQSDGDTVLLSEADYDRIKAAKKRAETTATLLRAIVAAEKSGIGA